MGRWFAAATWTGARWWWRGEGSERLAEAEGLEAFALALPQALEVGLRVEEGVLRPRQDFEAAEGVDVVESPFEVFVVIGLEEELAARFEDVEDGGEELGLNEAAAVMPGLRPRVRAEQVEAGDGGLRQQPFDGVAAFEAEEPDVREASFFDVLANLADAAEEALDAEEIALRVVGGEVEQERTVAAAEVDLQWPGAGEEFGFLQPAEIVGRDELVRLGRAGGAGGHAAALGRRRGAGRQEEKGRRQRGGASGLPLDAFSVGSLASSKGALAFVCLAATPESPPWNSRNFARSSSS